MEEKDIYEMASELTGFNFTPHRLHELVALTSELVKQTVTHGRGDGRSGLKPVEIKFVAELFKLIIDKWQPEGSSNSGGE